MRKREEEEKKKEEEEKGEGGGAAGEGGGGEGGGGGAGEVIYVSKYAACAQKHQIHANGCRMASVPCSKYAAGIQK